MSYLTILRPLLFRLNAEAAHNLAMFAITRGIIRGRLLRDPRLRVSAMGLEFPNPLGLAAGFDKNALAVERWAGFGFGFAELGTVTSRPQPGNPKPRLFRFPEQKAVVNRMGFNNEGSEAVARRLAGTKARIPIGLNLGKSKVTPLEEAATDYALSYERLAPFADYVVVNVSSPNTPGLRALQDVERLREIVVAMRDVDLESHPPLLVKIAPDLAHEDIDAVCGWVESDGLAGIVATNTTLDKSQVPGAQGVEGGLSGAPLRDRSTQIVRRIAGQLGPDKTLIGVGGIFSGADLREKLEAGAHLAQVYTGWVYGGPMMPYQTLVEYLGS